MADAKFKPGDQVDGKYLVLGHKGEGGMGTVLIVRKVATKKVPPRKYALKYCHDKEHAKRFAREVRVMRRITHPNVITVIDANVEYEPPYFVMPLADSSLHDRISDYSTDESKAIKAFLDVCNGVQAIHAADGVHRDIKPANALILGESIVMADLGLAKLNNRDTTILTQTKAIVGTDIYLAPEQRLPEGSRKADVRTDVYQLGKTLYELVTGASPAMIDTSKLSAGLKFIIRRATQEDPADRYQTLGELMDAVQLYEMAKDPALNVKATIESLLEQIKELAKRGEYRASRLKQLMAAFGNAKNLDAGVFIDLFDAIPKELFEALGKELPAEFTNVLTQYVKHLDDVVGGYAFSYADSLAKRMKEIVRSTSTPDIAALAIEATMLAGVRLNRFAAMEAFDTMLKDIKDDAVAITVAEMLRRNIKTYSRFADRIAEGTLQASLEIVRKEGIKVEEQN